LKLQIDEDSSRIKELVIENEEYASRIKKQVHDKDDNSALLARLTVEKSEIDANLSGMIEKISEITGEISNLREELSRLAFRKTKLEETKESCLNRLWDEYELTYTKACEISSFSGKVNKEARRKRINELKQEMKELGNVNVGAIDELEEVKTRYERHAYSQAEAS
jgi:chromosome segregation protein